MVGANFNNGLLYENWSSPNGHPKIQDEYIAQVG